MSITLFYSTLTDVAPEVREDVIADAAEFEDTWEPWGDGITIEESEDEEPLDGSTQLVEGDGDVEDMLMAAMDIEAIAGWMQRVSARYHLVWALNTDGDEIGQVDAAGPDAELLANLTTMAERAGVEDLEDAHARAAAIRAERSGA